MATNESTKLTWDQWQAVNQGRERTAPNDQLAKSLRQLVGQQVRVFTLTYFFEGRLVSADAGSITLKEAYLVLETGPFEQYAAGALSARDKSPFPADMPVTINMGALVFVVPEAGAQP